MPVSDSALGQVVGGEFHRDTVAVHDFDPVPAESASHSRKDCPARFEFDGKHTSLELFDDLPHYFNCIFFWQSAPYMFKLPAVAVPLTAAATATTAATAAAATATTETAIRFGTRFVDV